MSDFIERLPTVLNSEELRDKAFGRASKITVGGREYFDTQKKTALAKVSAAGDIVSSTLLKYIDSFPSFEKREDLFSELVDVLVGIDSLKKSLGSLNWCARKASQLQREYRGKIGRAGNVGEVSKYRKEFYGRLSSVIDQIADNLEFLGRARDELKMVPGIDPDMPTVVIAGYPNVGKSLLVEKFSRARPKIASYPFTTKGIGIGHFEVRWSRFQIIDTPGLLDRKLEERNDIELQAVLALKYLADVIVFMLDPSTTSGYPLEDQISLLRSVEKAFGDIPILVVENKVDIMRSDSERLKISALTGEGLEELKDRITPILQESLREQFPSIQDQWQS